MPEAGKPIPLRIRARAQTNYTIDDKGCWVSNYSRQAGGYAVLSAKDDDVRGAHLAHRASWAHTNGDIPKGLVIDHTCFNRACVNPDHLRAIPLAENTRRRNGAAFPLGQCKYGHPLSEQVTAKRLGREQHFCGACMREVNRIQTQIKSALNRLERVYGLTLTKKQQAMYDEFMPKVDAYASTAQAPSSKGTN